MDWKKILYHVLAILWLLFTSAIGYQTHRLDASVREELQQQGRLRERLQQRLDRLFGSECPCEKCECPAHTCPENCPPNQF